MHFPLKILLKIYCGRWECCSNFPHTFTIENTETQFPNCGECGAAPFIALLLNSTVQYVRRWSTVAMTVCYPAFYGCRCVVGQCASSLALPLFTLHGHYFLLVGYWLMKPSLWLYWWLCRSKHQNERSMSFDNESNKRDCKPVNEFNANPILHNINF